MYINNLIYCLMSKNYNSKHTKVSLIVWTIICLGELIIGYI